MAGADVAYSPGQRVRHTEFGEGVVVSAERNGFVRAFFGVGERQVALQALQPLLTDAERLVAGVEGSQDRLRQAWLALEAKVRELSDANARLEEMARLRREFLRNVTHELATPMTPRQDQEP